MMDLRLTNRMVLMGLVVLAAGCGGGGSGSGGGGVATAASTGVFIDSPVAGIHYQTETRSGVTNVRGEYQFLPGETVIFSIGDITLPAVPASSRVTPSDMGAAPLDQTVKNILRLIQSLDSDGNLYNGISIAPETAAAFEGVALDFSSVDFQTQAQSAFTTSGTGATLVSEVAAVEHFIDSQQAQLRGSWLYSEGPGMDNVLTFMDDGTYLIAHSHDDGESQLAGSAEWGTYSWDVESGDFEVTSIIAQSDENGGLSDNLGVTMSLALTSEGLVLTTVDGEILFEPIRDANNPLVGTWHLNEGEDVFSLLTFIDGNRYVVAHNENAEAYGGGVPVVVSSEWGSYSYSARTEAFAITANEVDLDGPGGFYDSPAEGGDGGFSNYMYVQTNGELFIQAADIDDMTLSRVGPYTVMLRDAQGDEREVFVEARTGVFDPAGSYLFQIPEIVSGGTAGEFDLVLSSEDNMVFDLTGIDDNLLYESTAQASDLGWSVDTTGTLIAVEQLPGSGYPMWTVMPIRGATGNEVLVSLESQSGLQRMFLANLENLPW